MARSSWSRRMLGGVMGPRISLALIRISRRYGTLEEDELLKRMSER